MESYKTSAYDLAIIGDGCSSFLLLNELSKYSDFKNKKVLLLGDGQEKQRSWCLWDKQLEAPFDRMVKHAWSNLIFESLGSHIKESIAPYQYFYIPGENFFQYFQNIFLPKFPQISYIIDRGIDILGEPENFKILAEKEIYNAKMVYNSAFLCKRPMIDIWQHFRGWFIEFDQPILDSGTAVLMDFSIDQGDECRFMYVLPTSSTKALVELTFLSNEPKSPEEYDIEISKYIHKHFVDSFEVIEKEYGQIPMQQGVFRHMGINGETNIGTLAGMVKASTGYAFKRMLEDSRELAKAYFEGKVPSRITEKNRFAFYDSLLLWIIKYEPSACRGIFIRLFQKRRMHTILKFMDQKTNLWEEINIFLRLPIKIFLKALYYRLSGKRIASEQATHKQFVSFETVVK
jgi:lycopene beta-cyclase